MGHFLNDSLIEHALVEENEGIRGHECDENAVEDAHARVKEEEKHAREHDCATHHLGLARFRSSLSAGEDWQIVVSKIIVDPLELNQGIDVLVGLGTLIP